MAESPSPDPRPEPSAPKRELLILVERAEAIAYGFFTVGVLLLIIGLVLALFRGAGVACLILGGVFFVAGGVQQVRAEVLRVRAKLEKD